MTSTEVSAQAGSRGGSSGVQHWTVVLAGACCGLLAGVLAYAAAPHGERHETAQ